MTDPSLRVVRVHVFCPDCGAIMIKRIPKPDDDWEEFYGCRNFPECQQTRAILSDGSLAPEVDPLAEDPEGALKWIWEGADE